MKRKPLETMILMDEAGELTTFRFYKVYQDAQKQLVLDLIKDNVYFRFLVTQTESGITELLYKDSERYRVSGIAFKVQNKTFNKQEYKYTIAESYDRALNLMQYFG